MNIEPFTYDNFKMPSLVKDPYKKTKHYLHEPISRHTLKLSPDAKDTEITFLGSTYHKEKFQVHLFSISRELHHLIFLQKNLMLTKKILHLNKLSLKLSSSRCRE